MERGAALTLRVRVPAKVNLHLAVGPRREDGYHDVVSILQTVSLHDALRVHCPDAGLAQHPAARRHMGVHLTLDGDGVADGVPVDGTNLTTVAAERLMTRLGIGVSGTARSAGAEGPRAHLHLTKRIPVAAGMAGGSADAAAALVGLNALWDGGLDASELRDVAATIGADVPFCLVGGTALATGTGTAVARVLTRGGAHWVIGIDREPLSTAAVYAAFDELDAPAPSAPDLMLHALRTGDLDTLAAALLNDLEPAAMRLRPALADRREAMLSAGALAAMVSGSGPTMLGLARDALHARQLAERVAEHFDAVEVVSSPAGGPELSILPDGHGHGR
jgi:4-diphosphocytidyl-2-C-methyl-D-erythritol kinase